MELWQQLSLGGGWQKAAEQQQFASLGDQGSLSLEGKKEEGMGKWLCVVSITSY